MRAVMLLALLQKIENCSPLEAAKQLADRYQLSIPKELSFEHSGDRDQQAEHKSRYEKICAITADWCFQNITKTPIALSYLKSRGLSDSTIRNFMIGYFPGGLVNIKAYIKYCNSHSLLVNDLTDANILAESKGMLYSPFEERIIFPIKDHLGRHCGFGGRIFKPNDQRPKYYNSKENEFFNKGSLLFGLDMAKKSIQKAEYAFLVEGYTDCITMVQYGFTNTIATLGTACTADHLKILGRYAQHVYVLYDGDAAGQQAMMRLTELCWQANLELRVLRLPAAEDPASFLSSKGDINALIAKAKDIFDYFIDTLGTGFSQKSLAEKLQIARKCIEAINTLDDGLKQDILLQKASKTFDIPVQSLKNELGIAARRHTPPHQREHKEVTDRNKSTVPINEDEGIRLEKKIFSAILSRMHLLTEHNEEYLFEYLPSPLCDLLTKLKQQRDQFPSIDFTHYYNQLTEDEQRYVSKALIEFEDEPEQKEFEQLLIQLQKKNWKVIVSSIKHKLAQAKKENDEAKVQKILADFLELKKKLLTNVV